MNTCDSRLESAVSSIYAPIFCIYWTSATHFVQLLTVKVLPKTPCSTNKEVAYCVLLAPKFQASRFCTLFVSALWRVKKNYRKAYTLHCLEQRKKWVKIWKIQYAVELVTLYSCSGFSGVNYERSCLLSDRRTFLHQQQKPLVQNFSLQWQKPLGRKWLILDWIVKPCDSHSVTDLDDELTDLIPALWIWPSDKLLRLWFRLLYFFF